MTDSTDWKAIARVQSAKLMLALERTEQLQDSMKQILGRLPYEANAIRDDVIVRANLLCEPLEFGNVPGVGLYLTVTTNPEGEAVLVGWQDEEHRIVHVVWRRDVPTRPGDTHP